MTNGCRSNSTDWLGWLDDKNQKDVIKYLSEEVRVLKEHFGAKRVRFTDERRGRLRQVKIFESAEPESFRPVHVIAYDPALRPFFRSMNWKQLLA